MMIGGDDDHLEFNDDGADEAQDDPEYRRYHHQFIATGYLHLAFVLLVILIVIVFLNLTIGVVSKVWEDLNETIEYNILKNIASLIVEVEYFVPRRDGGHALMSGFTKFVLSIL